MTKVISKDNEAVIIRAHADGGFWAVLHTNARDGIEDSQATTYRWNGKTLNGAIRWANRTLGV